VSLFESISPLQDASFLNDDENDDDDDKEDDGMDDRDNDNTNNIKNTVGTAKGAGEDSEDELIFWEDNLLRRGES